MIGKMLLAVVGVIGLAAQATAGDLTGAWVIDSKPGLGLHFTILCVLKATGGPVSGPCAGTQGSTLRAVGRLSDDKMRFRYTTDYNGSGVRLEYEGLREADGNVAGTVTAGSSSGAFKATVLNSSLVDHATTWKIDANIGDQFKYVLICTFRSDGQRFKGPCATVQGATLKAYGSSDGNTLKLGYDTIYDGKPVHVNYVGVSQSDGSLAGMVGAGGSKGIFTAARQ